MRERRFKRESERGDVGLGGPGHGLVFGIPFDPNLNSVSVSVSVYLDHGSVRS